MTRVRCPADLSVRVFAAFIVFASTADIFNPAREHGLPRTGWATCWSWLGRSAERVAIWEMVHRSGPAYALRLCFSLRRWLLQCGTRLPATKRFRAMPPAHT